MHSLHILYHSSSSIFCPKSASWQHTAQCSRSNLLFSHPFPTYGADMTMQKYISTTYAFVTVIYKLKTRFTKFVLLSIKGLQYNENVNISLNLKYLHFTKVFSVYTSLKGLQYKKTFTFH